MCELVKGFWVHLIQVIKELLKAYSMIPRCFATLSAFLIEDLTLTVMKFEINRLIIHFAHAILDVLIQLRATTMLFSISFSISFPNNERISSIIYSCLSWRCFSVAFSRVSGMSLSLSRCFNNSEKEWTMHPKPQVHINLINSHFFCVYVCGNNALALCT